jgi:hypothetical protein
VLPFRVFLNTNPPDASFPSLWFPQLTYSLHNSCTQKIAQPFCTQCLPACLHIDGGTAHFLAARHSQLSPLRTGRSRNCFRIRTSQVIILKDFNPIRFCTSKPLHVTLKTKDFNSRRICTYTILTTKPFRMRTSKKTQGGGRHDRVLVCPTRIPRRSLQLPIPTHCYPLLTTHHSLSTTPYSLSTAFMPGSGTSVLSKLQSFLYPESYCPLTPLQINFAFDQEATP